METVRINPAIKLHRLGKRYMIVGDCADNSDIANVYTLNSTAGQLWLRVRDMDFSAGMLADILCSEYAVERERALSDAVALVGKWREYGFLIEEK